METVSASSGIGRGAGGIPVVGPSARDAAAESCSGGDRTRLALSFASLRTGDSELTFDATKGCNKIAILCLVNSCCNATYFRFLKIFGEQRTLTVMSNRREHIGRWRRRLSYLLRNGIY